MSDQQNVTEANDSKRILVVDDVAEMRQMLSLTLQRHGYTVYTAGSGAEALNVIQQEGIPDLAILDIVMPGMDGFALAAELSRIGDIPIIFLSVLTDTNIKVEGLTNYAEDYITKPFVASELLARVRRVLRRTAPGSIVDLELVIDEHLRINVARQYVVVGNEQIVLTPIESRLLHILYNHRGRVLSPSFLLAEIWDLDHEGKLESLWVHIRRLRRKIEPNPDNPRYIITVREQGYYFSESKT